jgi:hypothetical protein
MNILAVTFFIRVFLLLPLKLADDRLRRVDDYAFYKGRATDARSLSGLVCSVFMKGEGRLCRRRLTT